MARHLITPLSHQAITLTGADAKAYLQGQVTQDVVTLSTEEWRFAGHCNAKGKLWSITRVCQFEQGFLLLGSAAETNASLRELKKYGVFSKVDIALSEHAVFGVISDDLPSFLAAQGISLDIGGVAHTDKGTWFGIDAQRAMFVSTMPDVDFIDTHATTEEHWRSLSILAGEPELSDDHLDEFVPQMLNLHALGGISFTKGCYTGQETVARMKYLGKNKRAMYCLTGDALEQQATPIDLEVVEGDKVRRAGKIIAHATYQGTLTILAVMPNDSDVEGHYRLKDTTQRLTIQALPYTLNDE